MQKSGAVSSQIAQSSTPAAPGQPPAEQPQQAQPAPAPQPVQPQPPARAACLDAFGGVMDASGILFNYDSSDLRRDEVPVMDRIANYARSCPQAHFKVDGHTDSAGSRRYNQDLSERRAGTVISELEARGVDPARLSPVTGHGEGDPKESNWSRDGRQANRRVDIFMTE